MYTYTVLYYSMNNEYRYYDTKTIYPLSVWVDHEVGPMNPSRKSRPVIGTNKYFSYKNTTHFIYVPPCTVPTNHTISM